ncbi:MAG: RHS repeat protein [Lachnospiraceae bacterium]|nr:RHS repeat protein [Lachnospiraceae bacterium]
METRYAYNIYVILAERRARKTDGAELADSYEYMLDGLLKPVISQGMHCGYAHDTVRRLMEKKASSSTLLAFRYDLNGNLMHQTDVTGRVTEYRYDLANNVELLQATC